MAGAKAAGAAPVQGAHPKRQRRKRGSLDVESIIAGAFELAKQVSLNALTMPKLARHLDVPLTSIYWHFQKKEALLDAMADRATKKYHFSMPFVGVENWQEGLRQHFRDMRQVFRDEPVLCDLILVRANELSADTLQYSLRNLESAVGTLVEAGFSAGEGLDLYMTLSLHTRGVAVLEHLDTATTTQDVSRIPSATHTPRLHELAVQGHLSASITDATFASTVDAVISQAERLLLTKTAPPPP